MIVVKPLREERDQRGRQIFKGSYIFSYTWDRVGGGFPHINKAVNLSRKLLKGFPADSVRGCSDARSVLKAEQERWFRDDCSYVDVNEELNRNPLQAKDLFVYLAKAKILSVNNIISCGGQVSIISETITFQTPANGVRGGGGKELKF